MRKIKKLDGLKVQAFFSGEMYAYIKASRETIKQSNCVVEELGKNYM